jgi:hypothetical protein
MVKTNKKPTIARQLEDRILAQIGETIPPHAWDQAYSVWMQTWLLHKEPIQNTLVNYQEIKSN